MCTSVKAGSDPLWTLRFITSLTFYFLNFKHLGFVNDVLDKYTAVG